MKNSSILFILLLWYIKGNSTFDDKNKLLFKNATREIHQVSEHENVSHDSIEFLKNRRVYKGTKSKIKYYPFIVSIHLMSQYKCVGSIIKSDLVLTACSCVQILWNNRFYRENPSVISVNIGSSYYTGGGESISLIEAYFHPSYEPQTLKNNLAILRLVRRLNFRRKYVKKINIATQEQLSDTTEGVTIIGWGAKSMSNNIGQPWSNRLSYAVLHIYPLSDCRDVYHGKYERVTSNNFCGGFYSKAGGACNGDVGGPAIIDNVLVGVVSFASHSCGATGKPTVFTKVAMYRDWIFSIMDLKPPVQKKTASTSDPFEALYSISEEDNSTTEVLNSPTSIRTTKIQITPFTEPEVLEIPSTKNLSALTDLRSRLETFPVGKGKMKELILDLFESQELVALYKNLSDKVSNTPTETNYEYKDRSNESSSYEYPEDGPKITKMIEIDEVTEKREEIEDDSVGLELNIPDTTPKLIPMSKQLAHIIPSPAGSRNKNIIPSAASSRNKKVIPTAAGLRNKNDDESSDERLKQFNDRDLIMLFVPDRQSG